MRVDSCCEYTRKDGDLFVEDCLMRRLYTLY